MAYPISPVAWANKIDYLDTVKAADVNTIYAETIAIEGDLLNTIKPHLDSVDAQLADIPQQKQQIYNAANMVYRPSLCDLYQDAISRLMENLKSIDVDKPARTYTIQFTATTASNQLQLPIYSGLLVVANTDNTAFLADKAYISDVVRVFDLTADPNKATTLYTSFVRGTRTITLSAASDGTERTWGIICIGVPYQGLMPQLVTHSPIDTRFRVIYDPGTIMLLADGLSATEYSPFIARLPLGGASDSDAYTGNIVTVTDIPSAKYSFLPIVNTATARPPRSSPASGFSVNLAGIRGVKMSYQYIWLYGNPIVTFPNPYLTCYFCLVQAVKQTPNVYHDDVFNSGEILLMVSTEITTNKYPFLRTSGVNNAGDVFRLPGRPTYNGEVTLW